MHLRFLLGCLFAITALAACGSETGDETSSTTGGGEGGRAVTHGAGGGGGIGGAMVRPCMGCGEFVTSSQAGKTLCEGPSAMALAELSACICMACAAQCLQACMGGLAAPECSACKIYALVGACAAAYDACAGDV